MLLKRWHASMPVCCPVGAELWMADVCCARDLNWLASHNIDYVVDCTQDRLLVNRPLVISNSRRVMGWYSFHFGTDHKRPAVEAFVKAVVLRRHVLFVAERQPDNHQAMAVSGLSVYAFGWNEKDALEWVDTQWRCLGCRLNHAWYWIAKVQRWADDRRSWLLGFPQGQSQLQAMWSVILWPPQPLYQRPETMPWPYMDIQLSQAHRPPVSYAMPSATSPPPLPQYPPKAAPTPPLPQPQATLTWLLPFLQSPTPTHMPTTLEPTPIAEALLSSVLAEASLGTAVGLKDKGSMARAVETALIAVSVAEGRVARDVAIASVGAPEMRCTATLACWLGCWVLVWAGYWWFGCWAACSGGGLPAGALFGFLVWGRHSGCGV